MKSFGMTVNDQMYEQMEKGAGAAALHDRHRRARLHRRSSRSIFAGILFAIFNAALGGEASFKQVFAVLVHAGVDRRRLGGVLRRRQLLPRPRRAASPISARCCRCCRRSRSPRSCSGMIDIFIIWSVIVLAIGLGVLYRRRTQPIAISLLSVYAVIAVVVALFKSRVEAHESEQEDPDRRSGSWWFSARSRSPTSSSSGRTGIAVNVEAVQKRDLQAIVSASGKIQPQRLVNISADTMGRVTNLAVEEGQRVTEGPVPAADRSAQPDDAPYNQTRGVARGGALADGAAAACRSTAPRRR